MPGTIVEMSYPTRIVFGAGALKELPAQLARLAAKRPLVVTDAGVRKAGLLDRLVAVLEKAGVAHAIFDQVEPNPTGTTVDAGLAAYRAGGCDAIVGIGGGSPLDAAKGVRLMVTHPPPLAQYDDVKDGWKLVTPNVPAYVAIPTTSGTGSEVSRSFVVTLPETGRKTVIFAPPLIPSVALCDPELTYGLPPAITAATGMDAFTHNLEALAAKGFHPLADAMARKGIEICGRHLVRAVKDGKDAEARAQMMVAAITGACAFQKGLGAAHALAHALTPLCGVHHGLANAIVLPSVMEFNLEAAAPALAEAALAMGERSSDDTAALARRAVARVRELCREAGIPSGLKAAGVKPEQVAKIAEKAFEDASHLSNPRPCTKADLEAICRAAL
jgi:alcohol dehydrogenase class IV